MNCFKTDCETQTAYSFTWGWGTPAHCCELHKVEAQQVHDAQERGQITFTRLDPMAAVPLLERPERTMLIAGRLAAEQEADDIRARAAELHNDNASLRDEGRRLVARNMNLEEKLKVATGERDQVVTERDDALAKLFETQEELRRTKLLIPREGEPNRVG